MTLYNCSEDNGSIFLQNASPRPPNQKTTVSTRIDPVPTAASNWLLIGVVSSSR
jgi:hypothetical protein